MTRQDGRASDQLRKLKITKDYIKYAEGSCLIELGDTKVKMSGLVLDFLAKGDRGGSTNIIEIMTTDVSNSVAIGTKFALQIDNDASYQTATQSLNKLDAAVAYGTIGTSNTFYTAAGGVLVLPTLQVVRLDKCGSQLFCNQSNTPQTIFSPSTASVNTTTDVPQQSSPTTTQAPTPAPQTDNQNISPVSAPHGRRHPARSPCRAKRQ